VAGAWIPCTVSVRTKMVHHFGAMVFLGALHRNIAQNTNASN
jgi:hypothetical protein